MPLVAEKRYLNKELSWLSFNERVLQEACDPRVPLIERVRFLGIFSSNMDEFFRVHVAEIRRAILLPSNHDKAQENRYRCIMEMIQGSVMALQEKFDITYNKIMTLLLEQGIHLIDEKQLSDEQSQWLKHHFQTHIKRHITPLIINNGENFLQYINDASTYLLVSFYHKDKQDTPCQYSLVEIPTLNLPRFVILPLSPTNNIKHVILLDNIIRHCLDDLFTPFFDYQDLAVFSMKITRDADFHIVDELEQTPLEQMSHGLKTRLTAEPVRLAYDRKMPQHMLQMLQKNLQLNSTQCLVPGGRYHSFKDFIDFPHCGSQQLIYHKQAAISHFEFKSHSNHFDAIAQGDILLYYPYHKFSHLTELLRQAAYDPAVTFIKISLYRIAKKSRIIQSLIAAVKNGKKVTAIIELQARFDEQANINWTRVLAEAGVKVHHGIPSLKVHSKLCLIGRKEATGTQLYCNISSGNFNESTAKMYTDFSLFTAHQGIAKEVAQVFKLIKYPYRNDNFKHLIVSPYDSREKLILLIEQEIQYSRLGLMAAITLKLNNLEDAHLIDKLYQAASAGVKVNLQIRGICTLNPDLASLGNNIEVYSIIDRFLEHSRVMMFHAGGENKIYLCSADWMSRNLDSRIEVSTPIYDQKLKKTIQGTLLLQQQDRVKSRVINTQMDNAYLSPKMDEPQQSVPSQLAIYRYLAEKEKAKEQEKEKAHGQPEQPNHNTTELKTPCPF